VVEMYLKFSIWLYLFEAVIYLRNEIFSYICINQCWSIGFSLGGWEE